MKRVTKGTGEEWIVRKEQIKHGKWITDCMESRTVDGISTFVSLAYCSECGQVNGETNYCPNCGARMD